MLRSKNGGKTPFLSKCKKNEQVFSCFYSFTEFRTSRAFCFAPKNLAIEESFAGGSRDGGAGLATDTVCYYILFRLPWQSIELSPSGIQPHGLLQSACSCGPS
eukprot:TRINITY_DN1732_c0_g1_i2.p2 TRINITY_DN1732_c0_g1~~TRINITY_DN1732_c0_g1_i2.p2  ORF type:complete len:103 (+),score=1.07 TRINITY_DN1732_c0_g1_i2:115-423(+)